MTDDRQAGLREAGEAALTDFIYAHGSDFDPSEWPGMAALRAALAVAQVPAQGDEGRGRSPDASWEGFATDPDALAIRDSFEFGGSSGDFDRLYVQTVAVEPSAVAQVPAQSVHDGMVAGAHRLLDGPAQEPDSGLDEFGNPAGYLPAQEEGLNVERLAVTLHRRRHAPKAQANACDMCRRDAGLIAAEYRALGSESQDEGEP